MKTLPLGQAGGVHFLKQQGSVFSRVTQRLSSGMRINSAADDPEGLAMHSMFRSRMHGLDAAIRNVEETITMFDVQDSVLAEIQDQLMRIRDLAVRAAADAVLRDDCRDRGRMNAEVQALKKNIKAAAETTTFNTRQILVGNPIREIRAENAQNVNSEGAHPTWDTAGENVGFELDDPAPGRYPADDAMRIWRKQIDPAKLRTVTDDPPNAPADADNDGYVDHPLSDPDDSDPNFPGAVDSDGDGWPDPIDPYPADAAWPANAVDNDGDGFVSHPDIDPDDNDPDLPMYVRTDADGDGYVDHPWMDPDFNNKYNPDPFIDTDGDGTIDMYDLWPTRADLPNNPADPDGDGVYDKFDKYPTDPNLPLNPPDGDGDGWPTALDPDDADPANPGGAPPDADGDGVIDFYDAWPGDSSLPVIPDTDGDGVLDVWDSGVWKLDPAYPNNPPDSDGDGVYDAADPNPAVWDADSDGDGFIDPLDPKPLDPNYPISTRTNDADGDGYPDDANGYFDPDPGTFNSPSDFADTDGDGWPDLFDPFPTRADIPGAGAPPDADGDGFVDIDLFDPDPADPAVPFDKFTDADGDKYPDYIDGGPGDPAGDDNNPYLPLTHKSWEDRDPDWGSGGLAFASNRNTPYTSAADPWISDIFIYSDGQLTAVTSDAEVDEQPAWSADGKYLVWRREGTDIYYIEMNGCAASGAPQMLTPGDNPVFDPNSTKVYYNNGAEIWFMDVKGGATAPLADSTGAVVTGDAPYFSPGGDLLWYERGGATYAFDMAKLVEMEVAGLAGALNADLSPTGDKIAYESGAGIKQADIVIEYEPIYMQVGPDNDSNNWVEIIFPDARIGSLGIGLLSVESQESAQSAIDTVDEAITRVSDMRTAIGGQYNRAVKTLDDLYNQKINIAAAASSIGDADLAHETADMARANILSSNLLAVTTQGNDINRRLTLDLLYENFSKMGV